MKIVLNEEINLQGDRRVSFLQKSNKFTVIMLSSSLNGNRNSIERINLTELFRYIKKDKASLRVQEAMKTYNNPVPENSIRSSQFWFSVQQKYWYVDFVLQILQGNYISGQTKTEYFRLQKYTGWKHCNARWWSKSLRCWLSVWHASRKTVVFVYTVIIEINTLAKQKPQWYASFIQNKDWKIAACVQLNQLIEMFLAT